MKKKTAAGKKRLRRKTKKFAENVRRASLTADVFDGLVALTERSDYYAPLVCCLGHAHPDGHGPAHGPEDAENALKAIAWLCAERKRRGAR